LIIGDGHPVESDGRCVVEVSAAASAGSIVVAPSGNGHFHWSLPPQQAKRYADLFDGMIAATGPCHQYLDGAEPDAPVVLVSRDEYDIATLRDMARSGQAEGAPQVESAHGTD
jgi:hypothetical protein